MSNSNKPEVMQVKGQSRPDMPVQYQLNPSNNQNNAHGMAMPPQPLQSNPNVGLHAQNLNTQLIHDSPNVVIIGGGNNGGQSEPWTGGNYNYMNIGSRTPVIMACPSCKHNGKTMVINEWKMLLLIVLVIISPCLLLIPLCCLCYDCAKIANHHCQKCSFLIAKAGA